jgi:hypothetical protein
MWKPTIIVHYSTESELQMIVHHLESFSREDWIKLFRIVDRSYLKQ